MGARTVRITIMKPVLEGEGLQWPVDQLERYQYRKEKTQIEEAVDDISASLEEILQILEAEVRLQIEAGLGHVAAASFLATALRELPQEARLGAGPANVPYPSVVSMVENMETRRGRA